jgi:hypothetical protein
LSRYLEWLRSVWRTMIGSFIMSSAKAIS